MNNIDNARGYLNIDLDAFFIIIMVFYVGPYNWNNRRNNKKVIIGFNMVKLFKNRVKG